MRKSGRSVSSEVSGHTVIESLSENASFWTMSAGRGFDA